MKVRLIKRQTLLEFSAKHPMSSSSFDNWYLMLKVADWDGPNDIKLTFGSADYLGRGTDRIVFNIGGNNYRMICSFYFGSKYVHLYINWVGTHKEYDKLCDNQLQYTIEKY